MVTLAVGFASLVAGMIVLGADGDGSVGGVLVGAGLVATVDGMRAVRAGREKRRHDLDETRRLLYMALSVSHLGNYMGSPDAAGSVANALAHHSKRLTMEEAEKLAVQIATGKVVDDTTVTDRMRAEIRSITDELKDERT